MINKELAGDAIVRCKDCKHRPIIREVGIKMFLDFPDEGYCVCENPDNPYCSYCPPDDWFCADGEKEADK